MNELTIAWMTARKDAKFDWFCDSLHAECGGSYFGLTVMAIDYWANPYGCTTSLHEDRRAYILQSLRCPGEQFKWSAPKPTPWQGPYRQGRKDWFAAANARNTAVCLCETEYICFVDDLTVLNPGWLAEALNAMRFEKTVTCGSYRKVRKLVVVNGEIMSWEPHLVDNGKGAQVDAGLDNRLSHIDPKATEHSCQGQWLYGCSCIMPVEALLEVNGWDERCDGMGTEDYCTGINMQKKGWKFRFAPKMLTLESEEGHHTEGQMARADYGKSPNDKSHAMLNLCLQGNGWSPVMFGNSDLRKLRTRVLEHQPFPTPPRNFLEWYNRKQIAELD